MTGARLLLACAGITLMGIGGVLLLSSLTLAELASLTIWLGAVVVVHDGLLAPTVSWLRIRWYAGERTRPTGLTAAVQIGFMVGAALTLFVVPEIWAQGRRNPNPTILVGDYAARLLAVWAVIAIIVLVIARVLIRQSRRPRR